MLEKDFFEIHQDIRNIFDALGDAVYFIDSRGAILYMNRAAEKLDGFLFEEIKGRTVAEMYHLDASQSPLLRVALTKKPIRNHTFRYYVNNQEVYQICDTHPIQFPDGTWGAFSVQRNVTKIKETVEKNLELQKKLFFPQENNGGKRPNESSLYTFKNLVGEHPLFLESKALAANAAKGDSPIYLCGHTGTGKELFAQSIHSASERRKGPFLAINCAAIPETLLESLLFGTFKGVYTGATERKGLFERANGGTLFLDEINSMPLSSQAKLLRVLEEKYVLPLGGNEKVKIDTRIISSCNVLPKTALDRQQIREDLFYRLAVINILIPSLQERKSDIFILAYHFIAKYNAKYKKNVLAMDDEIMSFFLDYPWPGNVRQLKYCIECAMNLVGEEETVINESHLPYYLKEHRDPDKQFYDGFENLSIREKPWEEPHCGDIGPTAPPARAEAGVFASIRQQERAAIIAALETNGGNVSKSAKMLGLSRQTLVYRMKKHAIK